MNLCRSKMLSSYAVRSAIERIWYGKKTFLAYLLWPMSLIYWISARVHRYILRTFMRQQFSIPVIVVGNLCVGGTGKTPLVIAIAQRLTSVGLRVGIVSRGYGAHIACFPHAVRTDDSAFDVGDEPLLIAQKTQCPVVIAPKRVEAVQYLMAHHPMDVIISDDGLQHEALGRSIEIVVMDGQRGLGNGFCLPAGPLREPATRLRSIDFVVQNDPMDASLCISKGLKQDAVFSMHLAPGVIETLRNGQKCAINELPTPIAAVAAIGNPARFFASLTALGLTFKPYAFPDHYDFQAEDFAFSATSVIMTEKDAVKCRHFATEDMYVLPVEASLSELFWEALFRRLEKR